MVVSIHWTGLLDWTSGGVGGPAGPALAGPLFRELLVSFPDCIGTHMLLNTQSCIYDMQLLVIWRIPLFAVVLLLSLALHVGLLRRLPTSPSLCFRNNRLERRTLCTGLFNFEMPVPPLWTTGLTFLPLKIILFPVINLTCLWCCILPRSTALKTISLRLSHSSYRELYPV